MSGFLLMGLTTLKPRVSTLRSATGSSVTQAVRTRGSALQRERKQMIRDNPLCAWCDKRGIVRAGTQRDHIVPLCEGGQDTPANCQLLCDDCHRQKSLEEAKARHG